MASFSIQNTLVADSLTFPAIGSTYNAILTSPNLPGDIQFSNLTLLAGYYTIVNNIVSVSIKFTADATAPVGGEMGTIFITPPVLHIPNTMSGVGMLLTLSQVGLFGTLSSNSNFILARFLNAAGPLNVVGAEIQILGTYIVQM